MKRYSAFLAMAPVLLCLGCAVFDRDNTPTLNWVEAHMLPERGAARTLAYPVVIPLGLLAISADALIVHPATVIDDAVEDTGDCLWEHFDWKTEYVTECASLTPRTALTPVVFSGAFIGRSMFAVPERAKKGRRAASPKSKEDRKRELEQQLQGWRKALERAERKRKQAEERIKKLEDALRRLEAGEEAEVQKDEAQKQK